MLKQFLIAVAVLVGGYFLFWPIPIYPVSWDPVILPLSAKTIEPKIDLLKLQFGFGPEDLAVSPEGRLFGGLADGWVVSMKVDGTDEKRHFRLPNRPLGMEFDRDANLWLLDSAEGLFRANKDLSGAEQVVNEVDRVRVTFANDLDVDWLGRVFFTDTSDLPFVQLELDLIENRGRGRLIVYDPNTNVARTVLPGLHFANGVAVSKDQDFVLVSETAMHRIRKVNLLTGEVEVFIEGLPGFPDNVHRHGEIFWVALVETRSPILDAFAKRPYFRQILARIPKFLVPYPPKQTRVLGIDHSGRVMHDIKDPTGSQFHKSSSAVQIDQRLYLGSLAEPGFGMIDLKEL